MKTKVKPQTDGSNRNRTTHAPRLCEKELRIMEVNIRGLRSSIGELSDICREEKASFVVVLCVLCCFYTSLFQMVLAV